MHVFARVVRPVGEDDERRIVIEVGLLRPDPRFDQDGRPILVEHDSCPLTAVGDLDVDPPTGPEEHLAYAPMAVASAHGASRRAHDERSRHPEGELVEVERGQGTAVVPDVVELEHPDRTAEEHGEGPIGRHAENCIALDSPSMDMLKGEEIAAAGLTDWRKLAQGLHARYAVDDFGTGARFVLAVGEAGDALGHHPRVTIGDGHVDLEVVSDDAVYRDAEGTEHVVEWVTRQDVDLARRITEIAADHGVAADPASVSEIELGLDTARSATLAPVWAALLTGSAESQGRGSPSDEIRDATGRVPNLWFGEADGHETPRQRFHIEVYVAPEAAEQRIAAALAAGGTIVDDSDAPSLTVIADQDGNEGVLCVDVSAAKKD